MKKVVLLLFFLSIYCLILAQKSENNNGWYIENYTEEKAKNYFNSRYSLDLIEGIWQSSDGYKYSIERDVENGQRCKDKYRIIILESSFNGWNTTEIKGFVTYSSVNNIYSLKYYTRNMNGGNLSSQNILMLVENPLLISFNLIDGTKISLFKLYPKSTSNSNKSTNEFQSKELESWTGSSIVIGNYYLATNYHVVEGAQNLVISGFLDNYTTNYKVEVIASDQAIDLAILKVTDSNFKGFEKPKYGIKTNTIDVGTDVFVLGYPLTTTMGNEVKLTTGIISSKTGFQGDVSLYQISAPIQPGNSGGPLFDGNGNLIGIVNAKHKGTENVGYAIKLTYLKNLIESCNDKIEFNYSNSIGNLSLSDKVKLITPLVYIVKANYLSGKENNNQNITFNEDKNSAEDYYNAARQMYEDKQYEKAYELIQKSVLFSPNKENHYLRAFLAYYVKKDYDIAIESAKYCINNQYNREAAWYLLGHSYYSIEQWQEAIDAFTKELSFDRKNVEALYMRGLCKSNKGDIESALMDYQSALKFEGLIDFDYGTIYNNIAYQQLCIGDLGNAKINIEQAIKRNHFDGYIWDTYGELMYKLGDYKECIKYMGAAITCAKGEDNTWTENSYYYRGLANKKLGYDGDALEDLQMAKELGKKEADSVIINSFTNNNYNSGKYFNIYKNPSINYSNDKSLYVKAVELSDEYTTIYFTLSYSKGGWYQIAKDTYIQEAGKKEKMYLIDFENITINPNKTIIENNNIITFSLTFPAVSDSCTSIFFSEGTSNGWEVWNINISDDVIGANNKSNTINWQDVFVTDDETYANDFELVDTITKISGWGGTLSVGLGIDHAIKKIKKEAAKRGCCLAIITNIDTSYGTELTALIYKRPQ